MAISKTTCLLSKLWDLIINLLSLKNILKFTTTTLNWLQFTLHVKLDFDLPSQPHLPPIYNCYLEFAPLLNKNIRVFYFIQLHFILNTISILDRFSIFIWNVSFYTIQGLAIAYLFRNSRLIHGFMLVDIMY